MYVANEQHTAQNSKCKKIKCKAKRSEWDGEDKNYNKINVKNFTV